MNSQFTFFIQIPRENFRILPLVYLRTNNRCVEFWRLIWKLLTKGVISCATNFDAEWRIMFIVFWSWYISSVVARNLCRRLVSKLDLRVNLCEIIPNMVGNCWLALNKVLVETPPGFSSFKKKNEQQRFVAGNHFGNVGDWLFHSFYTHSFYGLW